MKHTIIYFIGVYDTLDLFTGKLREAFETMGYASFVYDARLPQSKDALLSVLAESSSPEREFSCVTFNNLGYNLDMEVPAPAQSVRENDACIQKGGTRNVWEYYGIPYLNILMDHPFHYEKPLRLAAKWNRRRVYGRPRGPSRCSTQKKGKGYLCLNRAKPHLRRRHRRTPGLNGKKH